MLATMQPVLIASSHTIRRDISVTVLRTPVVHAIGVHLDPLAAQRDRGLVRQRNPDAHVADAADHLAPASDTAAPNAALTAASTPSRACFPRISSGGDAMHLRSMLSHGWRVRDARPEPATPLKMGIDCASARCAARRRDSPTRIRGGS